MWKNSPTLSGYINFWLYALNTKRNFVKFENNSDNYSYVAAILQSYLYKVSIDVVIFFQQHNSWMII